MTLHDFALMVRQMRDAQHDYFKNRTSAGLILAKSCERIVDATVDDILSIQITLPLDPPPEPNAQP